MPIQPVDLQTLFMRLGQVGKEQAVAKEAAHLAQTAQGSELEKESEKRARTVNETRELEDGPEAVKEKEQKQEQKGELLSEDGEEANKQTEIKKKKKFFKDPDLGNKIDISG